MATQKWYEVYPKLATLLLNFHKENQERSSEILFYKLNDQEPAFKKKLWFLQSFKKYKRRGLDPIHIFSSFNQSKQKEEDRKVIINRLFRILGSNDRVEDVDFSGCPSPFSLRLMSIRQPKVQLEIWNAFDEIMSKGQDGITLESFRSIKRWFGIEVSSFTIFLFWINPKNFLPLDQNTQRIYLAAGIFQKFPRDYREYRNLLKWENSDYYIEIATQAYLISHDLASIDYVNRLKVLYKRPRRAGGKRFTFKIVAIQPLPGISEDYRKVLKPGQVYSFYSNYKFISDKKIEFNELNLPNLYSDRFDVSVSAIVGKNGSGKRTLSELIFLAINNIAFSAFGPKSSDLSFEPGVYLNLYYHADSLHRISLKGKRITWSEYKLKDGYFRSVRSSTNLSSRDLVQLFYTIAINYSFYSLNSLQLGDWIENLFHKNDGYQTPLVINPFRDRGVIDINRENDLVKSRLLSNLLQTTEQEKDGARLITDDGEYIRTVKFFIHEEKVAALMTEEYENADDILVHYLVSFNLDLSDLPARYKEIISIYIISKLHKICKVYKPYQQFLNKGSMTLNLKKLANLLQKLDSDQSHITNKLKQVNNYVKHNMYSWLVLDKRIPLDELKFFIEDKMSFESQTQEVRTVQFLPPSFLDFELFLNTNSSFSKLSSGEKQRIYSVSSIVYHLDNLNSVTEANDFINYPLINIVFDEIELYFHPEMQRKFISFLFDYINRCNLDNVVALNFLFITHSPFILSDIPSQNILFLNEDGTPNYELANYRTFGGNIHEMLAHNFFLNKEGYIGELANRKIRAVIKHLDPQANKRDNTEIDLDWSKEEIRNFIEVIGERLIRDSLRELYLVRYKPTKIDEIEEEIKRLENEKKKLS